MYDYLKALFGDGGGLTYEQFVEKLKASEGIELVNLAEGGYVPRDEYASETEKLRDRLAAQERDFAERTFLSGYRFTSRAAENGVLAELRAKAFPVENGALRGAEDFMRSLMENDDYRAAFRAEEGKPADRPVFASASAPPADEACGFDFGFTHIR